MDNKQQLLILNSFFLKPLPWQLHLLFWSVMTLFIMLGNSFFLGGFFSFVNFFASIIQTATYIFIYYIFVYFIFLKIWNNFTASKIIFLAIALILSYYLISLMFYAQFYFIRSHIIRHSSGYMNYVNYYLSDGLKGIFRTELIYSNVTQSMYNLFLPFLIKMTKTVVNLNLKSIKLESNNLNLEKNNLDLELSFLKLQINPHFFFNVLNSIYSLSLKNDIRATDFILKLSDLMRYTLYETYAKNVLLKDEINFLENYIDLEKIRHSDNHKIEFIITGQIHNQRIAPLILITFIENAFKHGIKDSLGAAWLIINFEISCNQIHFKVENNKPINNHDTKIKYKSSGIGIVNTKRRLDLLYHNKYSLNLTEDNNTYKIDLIIELE